MKTSSNWLVTLSVLTALICTSPAPLAAKIAGIELDESIAAQGSELVLNGAGLRKKLFIKLYVGSLYTADKQNDAAAVVSADEPMMIRLNILSDLLTRKKLIGALNDGFKQSTGDNLEPIQGQIDEMINAMSDKIRPGDSLSIFYQPETGTQVMKNGAVVTTIEGIDFKQALFGIWLSDNPVQASLKKAMLGGS